MLRIAICDDHTAVCSEVEKMVLEYIEKNAIQIAIEVFYTGEALIHLIETKGQFDLIFLDIELKTTTGIEVGRVIRQQFHDHHCKIVFMSAVTGYEYDLFELQPFNFLRKPIAFENVEKCIDLFCEVIGKGNVHFEYNTNHTQARMPYQEILYFESQLKKIRIVTATRTEEFYGSLDKIKDALPKMFLMTHRSYIVNFNHVARIQKKEIVLTNGVSIPISQSNLQSVRSFLIVLEKEKRNARI